MSPSTRIAALTLQAAQRSALLAHISSTPTTTSNFSSSAPTNAPSTSSLSSAIYLSASSSLRAQAASRAAYEKEDASVASYMALKAGGLPAKAKAAGASLLVGDINAGPAIEKEGWLVTKGEVKEDETLAVC